MAKIIHVVAMTTTGLIGVGDSLPFILKEDLKRFKQLTENKLIIMGYNTFLSIVNNYLKDKTTFLKDRKVIVPIFEKKDGLSFEEIKNTYKFENVSFVKEHHVKSAVNHSIDPIIIVGGAKLFNLFPVPSAVFATIVDLKHEEEIKKEQFEKSLKEQSETEGGLKEESKTKESLLVYYPYFNHLSSNFLEFKTEKLISSNNLSYQHITYL